MNPPGFWHRDGLPAYALAPVAALFAAATARRVARPRWRAAVPVICCGNVTVGGAGKTTLALDLGARLLRRGARIAFLSRGYGGRVRGVMQVGDDDAATVGDEALLLAALAPTWVGADRAASARAAVAAGAEILVMDDGLQSAGLHQDLALLVIDGATGFGNGRVMPAGPLREPVAAGSARCAAAILIGPDLAAASTQLPQALPVLRASLQADAPALAGRRVAAFAGIARPAKFYLTLEQSGAVIAGRRDFPDHHAFRSAELRHLTRWAHSLQAELVTTPKDAVRLPPAMRPHVLVAGVRLAWADDRQIETLLDQLP